MEATYGRVMKQALGEDDGGYSSNNRFDRPFHAADSRCPNTSACQARGVVVLDASALSDVDVLNAQVDSCT